MDQELAKELRELVRIFVRKLGVLEKGEASCCGITLGQCHALVEIGNAGDISLNELADLLGLDKSTMSRTVNNLVENNLIERLSDPEDRRYVKISLTPKGKSAYQDIEQGMSNYFLSVLEKIPPDKHGQVLESLHLLIKAVGNSRCC